MTNRIAIWLIVLIAGFFVLDYYVLHLDAALYLGRRALDLIEWLAFWR